MQKGLFALVALSAFAAGCSGALRSPEMYRDDTAAIFEGKASELKACYDDVLKATPGAAGSVTLKFVWSSDDGTLKDPTIDTANSTAPEPVQQCVLKSVQGLAISPKDAKDGLGTWTFDFQAPSNGGPAPAAALRVTPNKG